MRLNLLNILLTLSLVFSPIAAFPKDFVVVIDPGHGGKDVGAVGVKANEKTINLGVALKLGDMIEEEYGDVCTFCRSDIAQDVELAHQYSVYSVPRILLFTDGKPVADVTGAMSHSVMKAFLSKHISRT